MQLADLPVFVINLERSPDRRAYMDRTLRGLGLTPTFIPAVDGRTLDTGAIPAYDRRARLALVGKDIRANEFGCYFSHLAAIKRILDEGHEAALIFEDDVIIDPAFPEMLAATLDLLPHFDMVRFATGAKSPKRRVLCDLGEVHALVRFNNTVSGLLAYLMTARGAQKALRYCERIVYPVDVAINRSWDNGIDQLGVFPFPVRHDWETESTIGDARFEVPPREPGLRGHWLKFYRFWRRQSDSIAKRAQFLLKGGQDKRTAAAIAAERASAHGRN